MVITARLVAITNNDPVSIAILSSAFEDEIITGSASFMSKQIYLSLTNIKYVNSQNIIPHYYLAKHYPFINKLNCTRFFGVSCVSGSTGHSYSRNFGGVLALTFLQISGTK